MVAAIRRRSGAPAAVLGATLTVLLAAPAASAELHGIQVTREEAGFYGVAGQEVQIRTRRCHEHACRDDVVLRTRSLGLSELVFLKSGTTCDVEGLYRRAYLRTGRHDLTVSREAEDWYEADGLDLFLQTRACDDRSDRQSAMLWLDAPTAGRLHLGDGDCRVDALYEPGRL